MAVEALGRPSNTWLPSVRFSPDLARVAGERTPRGGLEMPASARERSGLPFGGLEVELERHGDSDPTPQTLRELLDAASRILDINAEVNPVPPHP